MLQHPLRRGHAAPGATRITAAPRVIVLMGVAGVGKTTIGRMLAASLGWAFHDADDFHSRANVERMQRGIPLSDADRAPWLGTLRRLVDGVVARGEQAVLACSALKAAHRAALVPPDAPRGTVRIVHLRAPAEVLRARLAARVGHFAHSSLLDSQLATLEVPTDALPVDSDRPPAEIVRDVRSALGMKR